MDTSANVYRPFQLHVNYHFLLHFLLYLISSITLNHEILIATPHSLSENLSLSFHDIPEILDITIYELHKILRSNPIPFDNIQPS